jgi:hypothetical protein
MVDRVKMKRTMFGLMKAAILMLAKAVSFLILETL